VTDVARILDRADVTKKTVGPAPCESGDSQVFDIRNNGIDRGEPQQIAGVGRFLMPARDRVSPYSRLDTSSGAMRIHAYGLGSPLTTIVRAEPQTAGGADTPGRSRKQRATPFQRKSWIYATLRVARENANSRRVASLVESRMNEVADGSLRR